MKNREKAENVALSIFCPKCRKIHALKECPLQLNIVETYAICVEIHDIKEFPSIPSLKDVYEEEVIPKKVDPLFFISKRPWKNSRPSMTQGFNIQAFALPSQNN